MKKITIIIPLYNVANYIEQCCNSIISNDYPELEILFVDDCSTDSTMAILHRFLDEHIDFPYWKILHHEHNRGLSAARNTGLEAATGEYVYFLDSDDEVCEHTFSILANHAIANSYDVVVGSIEEIDDNGVGIRKQILKKGAIVSAKKAYAEGKWYVMAWNKLCRRDFLIENNLWFDEGLLHEDMPWSLKLACSNPKMYLESQITYKYRIRQASIMTSLSVERDIKIHIEVFRRMKDYITNNKLKYDADAYAVVEGKKCQLLYSLLERGDLDLYNKYFEDLQATKFVSPIAAYKNKAITLPYLIRDLGNSMPPFIGRVYKRMFFNIMYAWRHKSIEGALWR